MYGNGFNFSGVSSLNSGILSTDAQNGVSVEGGKFVLGNAIGAPGDPAKFLSNRDILMDNWQLRFLQPTNNFEAILFPGQGWSLSADVAPGAGPAVGLSAVNFPGCVLNLQSGFDSVSGVPRFTVSDALSYLNFDALQSGQVWLTRIIDDAAPPYGFFAVIGDVYFDGGLRYRNVVSTQDDGYNIQNTQSGEVYGDDGSPSPITYNLPQTRNLGERFGFYVKDGQTVTAACFPGEIVYIGTVFGTSFFSADPGSFIWIICIGAGVWAAESTPAGNWTLVYLYFLTIKNFFYDRF